MRRKIPTGTPMPKALACGLLEDEGRILFLKKIEYNIEKIELPCVIVPSGRSPVAEIKEKFQMQTGIEGVVDEIIYEGRFNVGSRRRKNWVPCLVFRITARIRRAKPGPEYSGFKWMKIEDAIKERKTRKLDWLNHSTSLNLKP